MNNKFVKTLAIVGLLALFGYFFYLCATTPGASKIIVPVVTEISNSSITTETPVTSTVSQPAPAKKSGWDNFWEAVNTPSYSSGSSSYSSHDDDDNDSGGWFGSSSNDDNDSGGWDFGGFSSSSDDGGGWGGSSSSDDSGGWGGSSSDSGDSGGW